VRVDHLVWYSPDLAEGQRHFASMDNPPAYGGEHPGDGTCNSLLSLGDATYIEILARDPKQPAAALDRELGGLQGQGLYHWAVGGVDLPGIAGKARAAGYKASQVVSGGRRLPNGKMLSWKLVGLHAHPFGALLPFFIDWTDSEHPALGAPRGGRLTGVELYSPQAEKLNLLFSSLGLALSARHRDKPGIVVNLESQRGPMRLESFQPMPRGFVI
jgi:glyoxalase-like protein